MRRIHHLFMAIGVSAMVMAIGAAALGVVGEEEPALEEIVLDSDGDGLSDDDEINVYLTDPFDDDSDDDGLSDGEEVMTYFTDPLDDDTDGDGLLDGEEVLTYFTDPLDDDSDDDGLLDGQEVLTYLTDPLDDDSDDDGLSDGEEVMTYLTDPLDDDFDDDGVLDGDEVMVLMTNPNLANSNSTKTTEFDESVDPTNDGDEDFDDDGFTNADELNVYGTDPWVANETVESGDCKATFAAGILALDFEGEVMTFDLTSEMTGKKLNHGGVVSTVAHEAPKECHGAIVSAVAQTDWGKAGDPIIDELAAELAIDEAETDSGPAAKKDKKPKKNG